MLSAIALLSVLLQVVLPASASPSPVQERASCATGFHIIVARAAAELPGEGSTSALAKSIAAKVPGTDSVGLRYPALPAPFVARSEAKGVQNLKNTIKQYVGQCPKANIVLLGYDQGAYVVADVLGGNATTGANAIKGKLKNAIKGVILLSDPSFKPNQPYDRGTSTMAGTQSRSRASVNNLLGFKSILRSYCDKGDTVCASGDDAEANRQYLTKYQTTATNFIASLYKPCANELHLSCRVSVQLQNVYEQCSITKGDDKVELV